VLGCLQRCQCCACSGSAPGSGRRSAADLGITQYPACSMRHDFAIAACKKIIYADHPGGQPCERHQTRRCRVTIKYGASSSFFLHNIAPAASLTGLVSHLSRHFAPLARQSTIMQRYIHNISAYAGLVSAQTPADGHLAGGGSPDSCICCADDCAQTNRPVEATDYLPHAYTTLDGHPK
jgi:hypothetical protein